MRLLDLLKNVSSKTVFILFCSCVVGLLLWTVWMLDVGHRWDEDLHYSAGWRNPLSGWPRSIAPITQHPAVGKRTLSMLIAERVRVFCWILTSPNRHSTWVKAVNVTWAPRCDGYALMSTQDDPTLPHLVKLAGVEDGREHVWSRTKAAWRHVYEHHIDDYDWFFRADDDAYLVVENLRFFLLAYNPDEKFYHGSRLINHRNWPHLAAGYMQGGVGYALSRAALRAFINEGLDTVTCSEIIEPGRQGDTSNEDAEVGGCFDKLSIVPGDSRDAAGKHRFLAESASLHMSGDKVPITAYFWYQSAQGANCCSDYTIGFHHESPNDIYLIDFLLYRLRPYGADLAINSIGGSAADEEELLLAAYLASIQEIGPDDARKKSGIKAPTTLPSYLQRKSSTLRRTHNLTKTSKSPKSPLN